MLLERKKIGAAVAEWLRRQIRNLLGISRTGSNPVRSEFNIFLLFLYHFGEGSVTLAT